jgi:hypothetical protein
MKIFKEPLKVVRYDIVDALNSLLAIEVLSILTGG